MAEQLVLTSTCVLSGAAQQVLFEPFSLDVAVRADIEAWTQAAQILASLLSAELQSHNDG